MTQVRDIINVLRDSSASSEEKWAAMADALDVLAPETQPAGPPRATWSIGAYLESAEDAREVLDDAWADVNLEGWAAGGQSKSLAQSQFDAASGALIQELSLHGDGPWTVTISGAEPREGDEGDPWSFSISLMPIPPAGEAPQESSETQSLEEVLAEREEQELDEPPLVQTYDEMIAERAETEAEAPESAVTETIKQVYERRGEEIPTVFEEGTDNKIPADVAGSEPTNLGPRPRR